MSSLFTLPAPDFLGGTFLQTSRDIKGVRRDDFSVKTYVCVQNRWFTVHTGIIMVLSDLGSWFCAVLGRGFGLMKHVKEQTAKGPSVVGSLTDHPTLPFPVFSYD